MPDSSQTPDKQRPVARPILVRKKENRDPPVNTNLAPPIPEANDVTSTELSTTRPVTSSPILVGSPPPKLVQTYSEEDAGDVERIRIAIRIAPYWLLSLLVHLIILIV